MQFTVFPTRATAAYSYNNILNFNIDNGITIIQNWKGKLRVISVIVS